MINCYVSIFRFFFILIIWEYFTLALADGFPLESEWQQVFSSLQDASRYSGRCQPCCSLYSLHSSSYFQVLQSLYQSFGECTERTHYNCFNLHFIIILLHWDFFTPTLADRFQVLQYLYQSFGECTKRTNYNWYYCRFFFSIPQQDRFGLVWFGFFV